MSNKKKCFSNSAAIGDKAAHVQNLLKKGNWTQIRKLAAEGVQAAVEVLDRRKNASVEKR